MTFDTLFQNDVNFNENTLPNKARTADAMMKVFEGRDVKSVLTKDYPAVISQLLGPRPGTDGENSYYRLQILVVPFKEREQGLATKYMKTLVSIAKKEKFDVFLTPDASYQEEDGMSKGQLTQWYKKLGFEKKHKDDFRAQDTYCYYA